MMPTGAQNWFARLFADPIASEVRDGRFTFEQYESSGYVLEMERRHEYYLGTQVVQAAGSESADDAETWSALFSGSGWEDLKAMLPQVMEESTVHPTTLNFVKLIIDNTQIVFAYPPKNVELHKKGEIQEDDTETFVGVFDSGKIWLKADEFCKLVGLCNLAFQYIGFDEEAQRIKIRNLPPYHVYVVPDPARPGDLQAPEALVAIRMVDDQFVISSQNKVRHVWQVWWRDMYWYEDGSGRPYQDEKLTKPGTLDNPYKVKRLVRNAEDGTKTESEVPVKPIVYMTTQVDEVCDNIYVAESDQKVLINQRIDRDLTGHGYTGEFQSFAIPFFSGMRPEELEDMAWSPGSVIHSMEKDASLQFAHPLAPLGEHLNSIVKKLRMFARSHGVDPELVDPDSKVESGTAKAQARLALQERREQEFPRWQPYVRELYWAVSIVWNAHQDVDREMLVIPRYPVLFKDDYAINIEFGELDPVIDPLADQMTLERWVDADFGTQVEVVAAQRRIKDPRRAEQKAKEIREHNQKIRSEKAKEEQKIMAEGRAATMEFGAEPKPGKDRIGGPGNPPLLKPGEKTAATRPSSTGGNVTSSSGNRSLKSDK